MDYGSIDFHRKRSILSRETKIAQRDRRKTKSTTVVTTQNQCKKKNQNK